MALVLAGQNQFFLVGTERTPTLKPEPGDMGLFSLTQVVFVGINGHTEQVTPMVKTLPPVHF